MEWCFFCQCDGCLFDMLPLTVRRKYLEREILADLANSWQFAKFLLSNCLGQVACKSKFANILSSKIKVKEICIRQYFTLQIFPAYGKLKLLIYSNGTVSTLHGKL